eukprot:1139511-Pelagomonas_calceolata.AAC.4
MNAHPRMLICKHSADAHLQAKCCKDIAACISTLLHAALMCANSAAHALLDDGVPEGLWIELKALLEEDPSACNTGTLGF